MQTDLLSLFLWIFLTINGILIIRKWRYQCKIGRKVEVLNDWQGERAVENGWIFYDTS